MVASLSALMMEIMVHFNTSCRLRSKTLPLNAVYEFLDTGLEVRKGRLSQHRVTMHGQYVAFSVIVKHEHGVESRLAYGRMATRVDLRK